MENATRTAKTIMMMDILNTGISNIIDIKATNKTRQVQTAWAGPVWRWLRTTASRQVSAAMDANYRSWTVATMTTNFSGAPVNGMLLTTAAATVKAMMAVISAARPLRDGCELPRLDQ